jgi:hypothetical protein
MIKGSVLVVVVVVVVFARASIEFAKPIFFFTVCLNKMTLTFS